MRRHWLLLAALLGTSSSPSFASRWLEVVSEHGSGIAQTTARQGDGLVLLASLGISEVGVISLDPEGVPISGIGLSVPGETWNLAAAVAPTSDGGLLVATIVGPNPEEDALVIRLDAAGAPVWQTRLTAPGDNYLNAIMEMPDGDVVGVGGIALDPTVYGVSGWVVRLTPAGAQRWSIAYSSTTEAPLTDVTGADAGGVIAVGYIVTSRGLDAVALRIDTQGLVVWQTSLGGRDDQDAWAVTRLSTGDYALVGHDAVFTTGSNCRPFLARFNGSGSVLWQKTVQAPAGTCVAVTDVAPSSTGGFAWSGFDPSAGGTVQAVDGSGSPLWARTFSDAERVTGLEASTQGFLAGGYYGGGTVAASLGADGLVDPSCPRVVSSVPVVQPVRTKAQRARLQVVAGPSTAVPATVTLRVLSLSTFDRCRATGF